VVPPRALPPEPDVALPPVPGVPLPPVPVVVLPPVPAIGAFPEPEVPPPLPALPVPFVELPLGAHPAARPATSKTNDKRQGEDMHLDECPSTPDRGMKETG
jgi:hypothetical protein